MGGKKLDRVGMEKYNNFGSLMRIKEYRNCLDIDIEFPEYNWVSTNKAFGDFKRGLIYCPYEPRVFGIGYHGEGPYIAKDDGKAYATWYDMLKRCYNENIRDKYPTYEDCYVCDEWLNFQNFAEWHYNNYYELDGERVDLEKDILYKNNNLYSPETCLYVPHRINSLFVRRNSMRGDLPIGVQKKRYGFGISCSGVVNDKLFSTAEEAFYEYKENKESLIKKVADEYKDCIPYELYNAMYEYTVEIDD